MKVTLSAVALGLVYGAGAQSPLSKVVSVLNTVKDELSKEEVADEVAYDKMKCWCAAQTRNSGATIADDKARLLSVTSASQGASSAQVELQQEIQNLQAEFNTSQVSLASQTDIRNQQNAAFKAEEAAKVQALAALDHAIAVVQNGINGVTVNTTGFLQKVKANNPFKEVAADVQKFNDLLAGTLTPSQKKLLIAVSQQPGSYQPKSTEILGVLKTMRDTFQANLDAARKAEAAAAQSYADLQASKTSGVSAIQDNIRQKQVELAQAALTQATATQDASDTKAAQATDVTLLNAAKEQCAAFDQQYQSRVQCRNNEATTIAQVIAVLTSDAARDAARKTFKPASFMQVDSEKVYNKAQVKEFHNFMAQLEALKSVSHKLDLLAIKSSDRRVAAVAAETKKVQQPTGLDKVAASIKKLIQQLNSESQADVAAKASCQDRAAANTASQTQFTQNQGDAGSSVQTAKLSVDSLARAVEADTADIKDLQAQLTKLTATRDKENQAFQKTVSDQQQVQQLLSQAQGILQSFYSLNLTAPAAPAQAVAQAVVSPPAFLQVGEAPKGFGAGGCVATRDGSSSALALITQILTDAQALQQQATAAEQQAKTQFDQVSTDTAASIQAKQQSIVDKNAAKSQAEQQLLNAQQDSAAVAKQLATLTQTANAIKLECDSIVSNFAARQAARDQEISALGQALGALGFAAPAPVAPVAPVAAASPAPAR